MTKDILDEARKMLEGVPEGPWSAGVLGRTLHMVWAKDGYIVADCATHHAKHRENVARDFIIWSRTGVPALIERVAALEEALKQGAAWFREYQASHQGKADAEDHRVRKAAAQDKADRNRDRAEYLESAILAEDADDHLPCVVCGKPIINDNDLRGDDHGADWHHACAPDGFQNEDLAKGGSDAE